MNSLTPEGRELVALGAALASNCSVCLEHHIAEAKKAGLTDSQIAEAIRLADNIRQVPARKIVEAAIGIISRTSADNQSDGCAPTASTNVAGAVCCA